MASLRSLVWGRLVSWTATLAVVTVVKVGRADGPSIGLDGTTCVLGALFGVLRGGFGPSLAFSSSIDLLNTQALLLSGALGVDGARRAVGALMHVWNMVSRLIVAYNMLPGVAFLTQDGIAVVV